MEGVVCLCAVCALEHGRQTKHRLTSSSTKALPAPTIHCPVYHKLFFDYVSPEDPPAKEH